MSACRTNSPWAPPRKFAAAPSDAMPKVTRRPSNASTWASLTIMKVTFFMLNRRVATSGQACRIASTSSAPGVAAAGAGVAGRAVGSASVGSGDGSGDARRPGSGVASGAGAGSGAASGAGAASTGLRRVVRGHRR